MPLPNVVTELGPVQSHVRPVAEEIASRWALYFIWGAPGRGTGDHALGLALDFMTYEYGAGVDHPGRRRDDIGHAIAAYVLANRVRLNVTYLIWMRKIASAASNPPWSWREYDGDNPHVDHVHVSFAEDGPYQPPPTQEDDVPTAQEIAKAVLDFDSAPYGGVEGVSIGRYIVGTRQGWDAEKERDNATAAQLARIEHNLEEDPA